MRDLTRWEPEPTTARIVAVIAAAIFAFAAFPLISAQSVSSGGVSLVVTNGLGWMSVGLAVLSLHFATRPFPTLPAERFRCPKCLEPIQKLATKCPHCGTDLVADQTGGSPAL